MAKTKTAPDANWPSAREINRIAEHAPQLDPHLRWELIRICEGRARRHTCVISIHVEEHPEWRGHHGDPDAWVCGPCRGETT